MKKNILKLFCLAGIVLLSACSSDDVTDDANKVDVGQKVTFSFTEEPYQAGLLGTKAQGSVKPQIVDLGNGMVAEATLTPDSSCLGRTRAGGTAITEGKFVIYAIKESDGTRADGGLVGHIDNGVFKPDNPSDKWKLEPGTYTFVCYNRIGVDSQHPLGVNLEDNSTSFSVYHNMNSMRGITRHTITAGETQYNIPFVMKHLTARVRMEITSYTSPMSLSDNKIVYASSDGTVPNLVKYDLKGDVVSSSEDLTRPVETKMLTTPAYVTSDMVLPYKNTMEDAIYLPDGSHLTDVFIQNTTLNPKLYGKSVSFAAMEKIGSAGIGQSLATTELKTNYSYTWHVKIRPAVIYLFSDGTVGTLSDKGSRTPIGIVVTPKTTSQEGLATALNTIYGIKWAEESTVKNTDTTSVFNVVFHRENGYEQTYNASLSKNGIAHADDPTMPAFYQAAHYNAPVDYPKVGRKGRWFLPSLGQARLLAINVAKLGKYMAQATSWDNSQFISIDDPDIINKVDDYFISAEGTELYDYNGMYCSDQAGNRAASLYLLNSGMISIVTDEVLASYYHYLRPFIYF